MPESQHAANPDRVNDFVVKFANVNGTGSASANSLIMKAIFRMGCRSPARTIPIEHPGPSDLVRDRVTHQGYAARAATSTSWSR